MPSLDDLRKKAAEPTPAAPAAPAPKPAAPAAAKPPSATPGVVSVPQKKKPAPAQTKDAVPVDAFVGPAPQEFVGPPLQEFVGPPPQAEVSLPPIPKLPEPLRVKTREGIPLILNMDDIQRAEGAASPQNRELASRVLRDKGAVSLLTEAVQTSRDNPSGIFIEQRSNWYKDQIQTPGQPRTMSDDMLEDEARRRAVNELAALKTVGLWTAPIPIDWVTSNEGVLSAIAPKTWVYGLDRSGQPVTKQQNPGLWALDLAMMPNILIAAGEEAAARAVAPQLFEGEQPSLTEALKQRRTASEVVKEIDPSSIVGTGDTTGGAAAMLAIATGAAVSDIFSPDIFTAGAMGAKAANVALETAGKATPTLFRAARAVERSLPVLERSAVAKADAALERGAEVLTRLSTDAAPEEVEVAIDAARKAMESTDSGVSALISQVQKDAALDIIQPELTGVVKPGELSLPPGLRRVLVEESDPAAIRAVSEAEAKISNLDSTIQASLAEKEAELSALSSSTAGQSGRAASIAGKKSEILTLRAALAKERRAAVAELERAQDLLGNATAQARETLRALEGRILSAGEENISKVLKEVRSPALRKTLYERWSKSLASNVTRARTALAYAPGGIRAAERLDPAAARAAEDLAAFIAGNKTGAVSGSWRALGSIFTGVDEAQALKAKGLGEVARSLLERTKRLTKRIAAEVTLKVDAAPSVEVFLKDHGFSDLLTQNRMLQSEIPKAWEDAVRRFIPTETKAQSTLAWLGGSGLDLRGVLDRITDDALTEAGIAPELFGEIRRRVTASLSRGPILEEMQAEARELGYGYLRANHEFFYADFSRGFADLGIDQVFDSAPLALREEVASRIDTLLRSGKFTGQDQALAKKMLGLYLGSLTRGSFELRPGYFISNALQNIDQVYKVAGIAPAVSHALRGEMQNLVASAIGTIPEIAGLLPTPGARAIGRQVIATVIASLAATKRGAAVAEAIVDAVAKGGEGILRLLSLGSYRVETAKIMTGAEGSVTVQLYQRWKKSGSVTYTYKELYDEGMKAGLDEINDLVELEQSFAKGIEGEFAKIKSGVLETLSIPREGISNLTRSIQKRQKWGLYTTFVEYGLPPKQAAKMTQDALYDMENILSEGEKSLLLRMIVPFWRVQKASNRQILSIISSPESAYRFGLWTKGKQSLKDLSDWYYRDRFNKYGVDATSIQGRTPEESEEYRKQAALGMEFLHELQAQKGWSDDEVNEFLLYFDATKFQLTNTEAQRELIPALEVLKAWTYNMQWRGRMPEWMERNDAFPIGNTAKPQQFDAAGQPIPSMQNLDLFLTPMWGTEDSLKWHVGAAWSIAKIAASTVGLVPYVGRELELDEPGTIPFYAAIDFMAEDWLMARNPAFDVASQYIRGKNPRIKIDEYSAGVLADFYGVGSGVLEQSKDRAGETQYYITDPRLAFAWTVSGLKPVSDNIGKVERREGMTKEDFARAMGFKVYSIDPVANPYDATQLDAATKRLRGERYMSASPEVQVPGDEPQKE